jgi:tetratricopeptide (TPR) repeat protein
MSTGSMDIDSAVERAAMLCDLSRWDEAATLLGSVLTSNPQNYRALCLLALARVNNNGPDQALSAALAAISLDPEAEWAYRLASVSMSRLGRHEDAVSMARRAVSLAPYGPEGYRQLARALVGHGHDLEEARLVADRALTLDPHSVHSFVTVGTVADAAGRKAEAEAAFRQALTIDPNSSVAHNELARITLGARRFNSPTGLATAAGGFATAVRTDPKAQVSRRNLDLVMQLFLARSAYLIFIDAYIASMLTGPNTPAASRAVPAALLLIPVYYAARFLSRLRPPLRRYVRDFLRNPYITAAVFCDALAVLAVVIGAAVTRLDTTAFFAAAGLALLARVSLWRTRTIQFPAQENRRLLGTSSLILIAIALLIVICGCALTYASTPGSNAAPLIAAGAAGIGVLAITRVLLRRRRQ